MDVGLNFRKLTGPIEHWLTTFHQGYWGFRPDKKEAWEEIEVGEVFVFHASSTEFLETPRGALTDISTGIIGLGHVGAKSTKSEPAWWEELHLDGNYPYLIHFSEIYWFGDTDQIRDAPVSEKDVSEMVDDIHAIAENIITFGEMRERAGYQIPAQGSPGNIKSPEKLFPLLQQRLDGSLEQSSADDESASGNEIRERNRDRDIDQEGTKNKEVTYEQSVKETISGTIEHEEILDTFEDYLSDHGFDGGETERSDLIMSSDDDVVLGEAKSIHPGNERGQIRRALGQLLEYRKRDIYDDGKLSSLSVTLCLILSQPPSEEYLDILESVESDGIFTYWIDNGRVDGPDESMARLREITA
ncbi:hypothetical protein [Haloarcula argentinensis]|uniref:Restriction endonuclease n=1 Tax=Haloarcula argentinensis TaxID=43776 RepID=A0ABU2F390_HALAR|nr:hypothetical protein [Haloarcula argentinensis]EMA20101.1 hypothetical protein C443_14752 [Haloarcula argentinensis DSM 12282]MDS0254616.1 hypothetical protein [Haloarcula argentinensis]